MTGMGLAAFGSGEMRPLFLDAGTGAVEAPVSGTLQVPFPATVAKGNFLLLHVVARDTVGPGVTTPSGWTATASRDSTDGFARSSSFWKVADGTETGNLDVTCTADTHVTGRMYRFSHGSGVEAAAGANTDASDVGLTAVDVTTLGLARIAVQLFYAEVNTTVGNIAGESNADYTELVAEYSSATGPVILSAQGAAVETVVAITGGAATLASAGAYRIRLGLAIKP